MNKQQLNNLMYPQHGLPLLLCIAGFFPLLTKMPYMIRAWGKPSAPIVVTTTSGQEAISSKQAVLSVIGFAAW